MTQVELDELSFLGDYLGICSPHEFDRLFERYNFLWMQCWIDTGRGPQ